MRRYITVDDMVILHMQATDGIQRIFDDQGWILDQTSVINPTAERIDYKQLLNWVNLLIIIISNAVLWHQFITFLQCNNIIISRLHAMISMSPYTPINVMQLLITLNLQEGDYRIIMINTFEIHAYHIICEVSLLNYITYHIFRYENEFYSSCIHTIDIMISGIFFFFLILLFYLFFFFFYLLLLC